MKSLNRATLVLVTFLLAVAIAVAQEAPQLWVTKLKVGQTYHTDSRANTWGKILQVVDDEQMLVGIDNGRSEPGGDPRYSVVVMFKVSTVGKTDGEKGFLGNLIGTQRVTVTGTTRYKTATGGSRTVFVVERAK